MSSQPQPPSSPSQPNPMPSQHKKIDLHTHFLPPSYFTACNQHGHAQPDGMPSLPQWSPESHLALMNAHNIQTSILSISSPGVHLVPGDMLLARRLARECNSYAAELKKRKDGGFEGRFGFWASLPLPLSTEDEDDDDVQACLEEIDRAEKEGCDGFVLMTNVHGIYLGDGRWERVFDELNRRRARVFVHPTSPVVCCSDIGGAGGGGAPVQASPLANNFPNPMLEFFFDTARSVTNLFLSGTIRRCPDIRIILPHLGGATPPLLSRWTGFSQLVPGPWVGMPEEDVTEAFSRQFWFDLAGFAFPSQIRCLVQSVGVRHSRLVYGSDYPFTKREGVEVLLGQMDEGAEGLFDEEQVRDICYGNAERLLGLES